MYIYISLLILRLKSPVGYVINIDIYTDYKLIIHEQRAHNLFIFELQW